MSLLEKRQVKNREISPRSKQFLKGAANGRSGQAGRVRTGRSGLRLITLENLQLNADTLTKGWATGEMGVRTR